MVTDRFPARTYYEGVLALEETINALEMLVPITPSDAIELLPEMLRINPDRAIERLARLELDNIPEIDMSLIEMARKYVHPIDDARKSEIRQAVIRRSISNIRPSYQPTKLTMATKYAPNRVNTRLSAPTIDVQPSIFNVPHPYGTPLYQLITNHPSGFQSDELEAIYNALAGIGYTHEDDIPESDAIDILGLTLGLKRDYSAKQLKYMTTKGYLTVEYL